MFEIKPSDARSLNSLGPFCPITYFSKKLFDLRFSKLNRKFVEDEVKSRLCKKSAIKNFCSQHLRATFSPPLNSIVRTSGPRDLTRRSSIKTVKFANWTDDLKRIYLKQNLRFFYKQEVIYKLSKIPPSKSKKEMLWLLWTSKSISKGKFRNIQYKLPFHKKHYNFPYDRQRKGHLL